MRRLTDQGRASGRTTDEYRNHHDIRRRRADQGRPGLAPRIHERHRGGCGRLHACGGPVRAEAITTDTGGLQTGDAKIKVGRGEMPAISRARPATARRRSIMVAMEIFGLHEYIKDVTRRLAKLGAFAIAPDYYFRKGVDLTKVADIKDLLPIVNAKPDAELLSDLDATVAWAGSQGGDTTRLGIIGFCRGGRTVWEYAAHSGSLKAGVAFYGTVVDPANPLWPKSPMQLAPEMKAPVLGLYGGADTGIPVAQVEQMKAALAEQEDGRIQDLSGSAARLPCRLSRQLPQGRRRRCLEAGPGLVQDVWRVELTLILKGGPSGRPSISRRDLTAPWRHRRCPAPARDNISAARPAPPFPPPRRDAPWDRRRTASRRRRSR